MSSHYAKPETALMKSKDFLKIGKSEEALACLHGILTSRRYRQWTETHEQIMLSYVTLAVQLQKNIKDALVFFQKICATANANSLAKVMTKYAELSEKKAEEARLKAAEAKEKAVEENLELSPELLLLQLSGDGSQDRTETEILAPWVRYLWETYRAILDVLRNNEQLKGFYQEMCRASFRYCRKYKRTAEFRRFVDLMRSHLLTIEKHSHQANAVNLKDPETQKMYLETRFLQLEIAAELELWQDAYRTIEDIHDNMALSEKPPTPELMKTYYEKLSQIFWASDNYLFHAYSLAQYHTLTLLADERSDEEETKDGKEAKEAKEKRPKLDVKQKTQLTDAVLVATLCILPRPNENESQYEDALADLENEPNRRLALLLGFQKDTPTRTNLLSDLLSSDFLNNVSAPVRELYELLEKKFGPTTLKKSLLPLLDYLKQDELLKKYVEAIKHLSILRLCQQLSTVFKTIRAQRFLDLCVDVGPQHDLERQLMLLVKQGHISLRIDHRTQLYTLTDESMESARMKGQLSQLAEKFQKVVEIIAPMDATEKSRERRNVFTVIMRGVEDEHKEVADRMREIERRKQRTEEIQAERERAAALEKKQQEAIRAANDKKRLNEEKARREAEKLEKERKQKEVAEKKQLVAQVQAKVKQVLAPEKRNIKAKAKLSALVNVEQVDKEKIKQTEMEILEQAKQETEKRKKEQSRRVDYLERALRIEERPLLLKDSEERKLREKEKDEEEFKTLCEDRKKMFDQDMEEKKRLSRMTASFAQFKSQILAKRKETFDKLKQEQDERFRIRDAKRKEEQKRREEEEEEQVKMADERKKEREQELAAKEKRKEDKRKADEEKEAKFKKIMDKQRAREAEIEAREQSEKEKEKEKEEDDRDREESSPISPPRRRTGWERERPRYNDRDRDRDRDDFPSRRERDDYSSRRFDRDRERDPRERGDRERDPRERGDRERDPRERGPPRRGDRDREDREDREDRLPGKWRSDRERETTSTRPPRREKESDRERERERETRPPRREVEEEQPQDEDEAEDDGFTVVTGAKRKGRKPPAKGGR